MIYGSSHIEGGRKGGDAKSLAQLPQAVVEIQRDISAAKVPPEKQGTSTPHCAPQPRALNARKGTHITSGCENQWGLCLPGRARCLIETEAHY